MTNNSRCSKGTELWGALPKTTGMLSPSNAAPWPRSNRDRGGMLQDSDDVDQFIIMPMMPLALAADLLQNPCTTNAVALGNGAANALKQRSDPAQGPSDVSGVVLSGGCEAPGSRPEVCQQHSMSRALRCRLRKCGVKCSVRSGMTKPHEPRAAAPVGPACLVTQPGTTNVHDEIAKEVVHGSCPLLVDDRMTASAGSSMTGGCATWSCDQQLGPCPKVSPELHHEASTSHCSGGTSAAATLEPCKSLAVCSSQAAYGCSSLACSAPASVVHDSSVDQFVDTVSHNRRGAKTFFQMLPITLEECRKLSEMLKLNKRIDVLSVTNSDIGDAGVLLLCDGLQHSRSLASLSLINCGISSLGAQQLVHALRDNMALTELQLGSNVIGDDGAVALAELVQGGKLKVLGLQHNCIGKAGCQSLAAAVGSANSQHGLMKQLEVMPGNPIEAADLKALAKLVSGKKKFLSIVKSLFGK